MIHLHTDFWEKARRYVENGGVVYASVSADAAIPDMDALFGARLVDRAPAHLAAPVDVGLVAEAGPSESSGLAAILHKIGRPHHRLWQSRW